MSELDQMAKMVQSGAQASPKSKETKAIKREMLEALIDRKLAKAEAKRRGIEVSEKDVNLALEDFKKRNHFPDDAAMTQALAKAGMTVKELRQQLTDQIQQDRLIFIALGAKKTDVPEAEVRRFYERNLREHPSGGNQVHLQIINMLFPPEATAAQKEEVQKKAEAVLKDFRLSGSVAAIRQKYSLTVQDLGFINQTDINPQVGELLTKLRPGEVAPVHTPQGFQLVFLVDRRSGKPPSFEEAAPEIRKVLANQAMQKEFLEWIKTLRAKAHIKIML
jgi:peptidyl-prolyl cis-trans isomerase SurA